MSIHNREYTSLAAFLALLALPLPAGAQERGPASSPSQRVTVIGCVARNGAVDPDKGTRQLDTTPGGYVLTEARISAAGRTGGSAVPGSTPSGENTGTIAREGTVAGHADAGAVDAKGFALSGRQLDGLAALIGRRVEVVGIIVATPASPTSEAAQPRGTSGTDRPPAPVLHPNSGTREERPAERSAHPSADLQQLDVVSFRGVAGACQ